MEDKWFFGSLTIILMGIVLAFTFYEYNELKSLERNVESAIVKGIDPIAVRCAYASRTDTLCISYAASAHPK